MTKRECRRDRRVVVAAILSAAFCLIFSASSRAQSQSPGPCAIRSELFQPTPLPLTVSQELLLGDLAAESIDVAWSRISDERLVGRLQRLTDHLSQYFPESPYRFEVQLVSSPVANAMSLLGGRIYVVRGAISLARNDHELAGLLAHEMAHVFLRHSTAELVRLFRDALDVETFGDDADLRSKWQRLREAARKDSKGGRGDQVDHQLEADELAMHVMARAGFQPQAFADYFDRLAQTDGKTGNWLSNLFGFTKASSKRLGRLLDTLKELPQDCRSETWQSGEDFDQWQQAVLAFNAFTSRGESGVELSPRIVADLRQLQFSPDGKFISAQDSGQVYVLSRDPFQFLFRIDSPWMKQARFTPDSESVLVLGIHPRVERWDIAGQRLDKVTELYVPDGCAGSELSPSGNYFACFQLFVERYRVRTLWTIWDVAQQRAIFEKKGSAGRLRLSRLALLTSLRFSPDGKHLVVSSPDGSFAVELGVPGVGAREAKMDGAINRLLNRPYAFLSPDSIAGFRDSDGPLEVYSFPSGKRLDRRFDMPATARITPATGGDYLLLRPIPRYGVGVLDWQRQKVFLANRRAPFDVYAPWFVSQRANGELGLYRIGEQAPTATITLPGARLGQPRVAFSDDAQWIAVSEDSQGGIWNVSDGRRAVPTRGFDGAWFDSAGVLSADFPPADDGGARQIVRLNPGDGSESVGPTLPEAKQTPVALSTRGAAYGMDWTQRGPFMVSVETTEDRSDHSFHLYVRDTRTDRLAWEKLWENPLRVDVAEAARWVLVSWDPDSDEAKDSMRRAPGLKKAVDALGDDHAIVVQLHRLEDGSKVHELVLRRSLRNDFSWDATERHFVYDLGDGSQSLVSLDTGRLAGELLGLSATLSRDGRLVAVANSSGDIRLHDVSTLDLVAHFALGSPPVHVRFSKSGSHLLVLTTDQRVMRLATPVSSASASTFSRRERVGESR